MTRRSLFALLATTSPVLFQGESIHDRYSGYITWTNTSTDADGTVTEAVMAVVTAGKVSCDVAFSSPSHSAKTNGPGLISIIVGLRPDSGAGQSYQIRVACPNAEYSNGVRPAKWSHQMDTFRQPGGDVRMDPQTRQQVYPEALRGTLTDGDATGSSSMTWSFCRGCKAPPAPPPP